ncbi:Protein of unknown function DUF2454 [Phaffia rhodozyma]|uniref:Uncharacterized protein n=1 Tax=Phaffia rhodozyma TaxID=264483 RepID=A0A0F7SU96_PHARH|nr:Protein of unknown function DUF2454 [Phaffia rhodozyma]
MAVIIPPPPPLHSILVSLQPPEFLPPPHQDHTTISRSELDKWRESMTRAIHQTKELLELGSSEGKELEEVEKISLAEGLARWETRNLFGEQELEGWILPAEVTEQINELLSTKLPPPSLESLKPIFSSSAPAQISMSSFRPLSKPIISDEVAPEREKWKQRAGWGCWNILRRAIEGLDPAQPPPFPLLLPPLLTLMDDPDPIFRLRAQWAFYSLLEKTKKASLSGSSDIKRGWGGKWLVQTGIGALFFKSLNTSLHLPSPSSLPQTLTNHLALTELLYPMNSQAKTDALDELIERGLVGTWIYRTGGEEGEGAREIATWLRGGELVRVLGDLGTVRVLGIILPSLLLPLGTLSPTSPRSTVFLSDLLQAISVFLVATLKVAPKRVAAWRGKVFNGLGRLWVAVVENEKIGGELTSTALSLKQQISQILGLLAQSYPAFLDEVKAVASLDPSIFEGFVESIPDTRLDVENKRNPPKCV